MKTTSSRPSAPSYPVTSAPHVEPAGDSLVDVQIVDVRRVLDEAFVQAAGVGETEPIGYLLDTDLPVAQRIARRLPGVEDVARAAALKVTRFVGYLWRDDIARALNDEINRRTALLLHGVPLGDPDLRTVVVLVPEARVVGTVSRSALLAADAGLVIARVREAGWNPRPRQLS